MGINLDKYQILDQFNVSRETCYQLDYYKGLVLEKNNKINLISRKDINNFIESEVQIFGQMRHMSTEATHLIFLVFV